MANIEIVRLPTTNVASLSDSIHVYTLSGNSYIPSTHKLSELSNFIFSGEQMENIKEKYRSLLSTFNSFKTWVDENYFRISQANNELTTPEYFNEIYDSVWNVDRVKKEIMDEYATPQDLTTLREAIYAYVENLALAYGSYRSAILASMSYRNESSDSDSESYSVSVSDGGGGGSSGGSDTSNAPIISRSNYQFWYGCVNCWSTKVNGKYPFEDQIPKLKSAGCTGYHIEMYAWSGNASNPNSLSNIRAAYEKLLSMCRSNKMWLFVDVINGNFNGSSTKWTAGLTDRRTVAQIISSHGQGLIDIIKSNGPGNVIVQPIGEPGSKGQNADCHRFQDMCCNQLTNFTLVTEPNRSNSATMTSRSKYTVEHVSNSLKAIDENDKLIKGKNDGVGSWSNTGATIAVSDTGSAIQALASPEEGSQQGWLNKWTSACSRASRLTNAVSFYKGKSAVFVYYAFKFKCMGTNGSTIDGELNKGTWNTIKNIVNPKYP